MQKIMGYLEERSQNFNICPDIDLIFRAIELTPLDRVKVVIIGQDPYHGEGQADGLCFSVNSDNALPPSLQNIFKELENDTGISCTSGDLTPWAEQGILLVNTCLTVEEGRPGSHGDIGWENFTDKVIKVVSDQKNSIIFVLWGNWAKKKQKLIDGKRHIVLTAAHPSPLSASRGFFKCGHFSKINMHLKSSGMNPINWET